MPSDDGAPIVSGLWLVATPIGNLEDLTARAARVLRAATVVCCEDSRRTRTLLDHVGARPTHLLVVNEHTEHDVTETVLRAVGRGAVVALVSDAGTPSISDPGRHLVSSAITAGVEVHAAPGATAFVMAVTMSGMDTSRIMFEGFIPRSGPDRRARIGDIARQRATSVIYEAPHRLLRTLEDLAEVCGGDREVVVARELTKIHEELWRGSLAGAVERARRDEPRGEQVIVLAADDGGEESVDDERIIDEIGRCRGSGLSTRDTVDHVAAKFGIARNRVYQLAVGDG